MRATLLLAFGSLASAALSVAAPPDPSNGPAVNALVRNPPDSIVDLRTAAGAALVDATWRTRSLDFTDVEFRAAGEDMKPSGAKQATRDVRPRATAKDFDDSEWEVIGADTLETRRSTGRFAGQWYRLEVTLPDRIGSFDARGSVAVLEVTVDDYAEVWIDGKLPLTQGAGGGSGGAIAGWNAAQRVVLTNDVRPGQVIDVAILAFNGPLSAPPENFVWFRSATLDFYSPARWRRAEDVRLVVEADDPALASIVASNARLERVATGFAFAEGPCPMPDGSVVFSDPNRDVIYRWSEGDGVSVYRTKSGYAGADAGEYRQPGSNGLALDPEGRLAICEHGNRRVTRIEKNGVLTVLADRFEGKRLNSPNDLVYRSDGALFFSDPPFGLPRFHDDPRREVPFCGVYALVGGVLSLVDDGLRGPNGVDLSPDERFLYVANWDEEKKTVTRYAIDAGGRASGATVFADLTGEPGEEALDGLEVDARGNVFVSGPGGVFVFDSSGRRLGKLAFPELPANFAFVDADTSTLILAARTGLYRLHLRPATP